MNISDFCQELADASNTAIVVASSAPHVTVVHTLEVKPIVDELVAKYELRTERIGDTAIKVFGLVMS